MRTAGVQAQKLKHINLTNKTPEKHNYHFWVDWSFKYSTEDFPPLVNMNLLTVAYSNTTRSNKSWNRESVAQRSVDND